MNRLITKLEKFVAKNGQTYFVINTYVNDVVLGEIKLCSYFLQDKDKLILREEIDSLTE